MIVEEKSGSEDEEGDPDTTFEVSNAVNEYVQDENYDPE